MHERIGLRMAFNEMREVVAFYFIHLNMFVLSPYSTTGKLND